MAISDDFTIDYAAQTITYTGGFTGGKPDSIYTANEWYTYLMDTFDELGQMDDPIPVEAKTPTEYVLLFPWFMDDESFKALYEGSIRTSGWNRVPTVNNGIIQIVYSTVDPTGTDVGKPIVHETDNDSGVLVAFDTTRKVLWIRPDDATAANNFDSGSGNLDITGGTQNIVQTGASETGEAIWYNIYSLGTIELETEIYVVQVNDFTEVSTPTLTKLPAWWDTDTDFTAAQGVAAGHVDLLIKIMELGQLIDKGYLLVMARQYSKSFSHFQLIGTAAGRAAVPLSTGDDLDNTTGWRTVSVGSASGNYIVDEVITGGSSGAKGIVLAETGDPTSALFYYLVGDITVDFTNGETITGEQSTVTGTAGTPADYGPALDTDITVTFGDTQQDLNNGNGTREYSVVVDCNDNTLAEVYQRLKFLARRGSSSDIDAGAQSVIGEFYLGIGDARVAYNNGSQDDPFTDGEVITGGTSGATGIVTARHDTGASVGFLILRQVRGTFQNLEQLSGGSSGHTADVNGAPTPLPPVTASPFGTYAGGKFFGARGVWLSNVLGSEANNFQLIDTTGVVQIPPQTVAIVVSGLQQYDRVAVLRLVAQGGAINKNEFSGMAATGQSLAVINVGATIGSDHPSAGVVTVVAVDEEEEHQYRYTSFTGTQFTLSAGEAGTADAGGSTTRLVDSAVNFLTGDIEVGDMIRNVTNDEYAWVVKIVDADNIDTTPVASGWGDGDSYESNQTVIAYDTSDDVYVPFLLEMRTSAGSSSATITYSTDVYATVRVRQSSEVGGGGRIIPFISPMTIDSDGASVAAIRTDDEIIA